MAWHDPVHELITQAAIQSLPQALQQQWAAEIPQLTGRYCLYPDIYANADAAEKARLKLFCEVGGGRFITSHGNAPRTSNRSSTCCATYRTVSGRGTAPPRLSMPGRWRTLLKTAPVPHTP
jgi:hypothetical protein